MGVLGTRSLPESQPRPMPASAVLLLVVVVVVGILADVKATHFEGGD